jgi:hypothetical protein
LNPESIVSGPKALIVEALSKGAARDAVVNRDERADFGLVELFLVFGDARHSTEGYGGFFSIIASSGETLIRLKSRQ